MIKVWWTSLEPRERLLLSIGGLLTLVVITFQFVYVPSKTFKDRASNRYASQAAMHSEVTQTLRVYENSPRQTRSSTNGPVQGIVSDSSAVFGISISRIEPTSTGDLTLWIEEIDPQSLYAWLTDLETNYGISVSKASIRINQDTQTVNANVFVSRGN